MFGALSLGGALPQIGTFLLAASSAADVFEVMNQVITCMAKWGDNSACYVIFTMSNVHLYRCIYPLLISMLSNVVLNRVHRNLLLL